MNSNYVIPVAVAAAFHGVLLFGIPKSPPRLAAAQEVTKYVPFSIVEPEPEVVVTTESGGEKSEPKEPVALLPIVQPEPLAPVVDPVFPFTPPKIDPSAVRSDGPIIPTNLNPGGDASPGVGFGPVLPIDLDNSPRTRFQPAPHYPQSAKIAGLTGEVLVEFTVDENGRVLEPHVVRSSDRMFEEPSLRAVAKWQFEPGRSGGRIVRFRMAVPVVFNLNE